MNFGSQVNSMISLEETAKLSYKAMWYFASSQGLNGSFYCSVSFTAQILTKFGTWGILVNLQWLPHCYFSLKCLHAVSDGKSSLSHSLVLKSHRRLMGCFTCVWVPLSHGIKGEMKELDEHWQITFLCSLGHHNTSCFVPPWLPITVYWALWNCGQESTLTPLSGFCQAFYHALKKSN